MVIADKPYKVIGTRPIRPDGVDKVIGRAEYGADLQLPGALAGRVLRSPHAHARIKRIDTSKAEALAGVRAVITAADFPTVLEGMGTPGGLTHNMGHLQQNVLARDKVLYVGHAVAAVCATDGHIAEDAVALIEVEYEVLPHVQDVRDAMLEGAPILLDDLRTKEPDDSTGETPTNVALHLQFSKGDVEKGFAEADVVIEREYETTMVHQGYIEPQNGSAFWSRDDHVTVWTSTQGMFGVRDAVAQLMDLPVAKVKLEPMEIGGGFGGKINVYLEPLAALLSKKTGKPVKMTMSRKEVLEATGPTCGTYVRAKVGAKRDGTITAVESYLAYEAGAFPGSPLPPGMMCQFGPYEVENQLINGYDVVVNKPRVSAYRAPGAPASGYAAESLMDELAEALEMDPLELRLQNASKEGTTRADGFKFGPIGNEACLQAAKGSPHYQSELSGEHRGRGVASGFWFNVGFESSASAQVQGDGTVPLVLGSVDIGGTRAAIAMQMAEALGIPGEDVKPHVVDTDSVGFTQVTGGSRTAFAGGWAAYECAMDIRSQMAERAAKIWGCRDSCGQLRRRRRDPGPADEEGAERALTFKELAAQPAHDGRDDRGTGEYGQDDRRARVRDAHRGRGGGPGDRQGRDPALHGSAGRRHRDSPVLRGGADPGWRRAGIGMALNEEYVYGEDGRLLNASLLDYRMPTALDLPMIDTILVEVPNPGHPYGCEEWVRYPSCRRRRPCMRRSTTRSACACASCRCRRGRFWSARCRTTTSVALGLERYADRAHPAAAAGTDGRRGASGG